MKTQTATLPEVSHVENGRMRDEKEQVKAMAVVCPDKRGGKMCQPITARFWMGRSHGASTVYCSIWADNYGGHGQAGGWGYHKLSAALSAAIRSSGITLSAPISGVGERAMEDALLAIAVALGYSDPFLVSL